MKPTINSHNLTTGVQWDECVRVGRREGGERVSKTQEGAHFGEGRGRRHVEDGQLARVVDKADVIIHYITIHSAKHSKRL